MERIQGSGIITSVPRSPHCTPFVAFRTSLGRDQPRDERALTTRLPVYDILSLALRPPFIVIPGTERTAALLKAGSDHWCYSASQ
jgi:hypothetical protein